MKQTAVEWLEDCLAKLPPNGAFGWYSRADLEALFKQAKEMEKEQVINACEKFGNLNGVNQEDYERYYNDIYGK